MNSSNDRGSEVSLSNFSVEYDYDGFLEVLVRAFDDRKMVLTFIDRAAIDDAWPDRRLSKSDRKLLVDRNLPVIGELISAKYERGEITTYQGTAGQVFPRIDIATAELAAVRSRLSDTMVLDVAAASGFRGAFYRAEGRDVSTATKNVLASDLKTKPKLQTERRRPPS